MAALRHAAPWKSLLVWAVQASVAWGAVAVALDLKTSGFPSRQIRKGVV
jgi:hypothetical protein